MPSFDSNLEVELQPLDRNVYVNFIHTVCSSAISNDGFLPYDTNIGSTTITAWKYADANGRAITPIVDTQLAASHTIADNIITVRFNYPSTNGPGFYKMRFQNILDNDTVLESDFGRVVAIDL